MEELAKGGTGRKPISTERGKEGGRKGGGEPQGSWGIALGSSGRPS